MNRPANRRAALPSSRTHSRTAAVEQSRPGGLVQSFLSGLQQLIRVSPARPAQKEGHLEVTLRSPWRAVSVVPGKTCCQAIEQMNARFLCDEAPRLPLADCTNASVCKCKYRHFEDRRHNPRRSRDGAPRSPSMNHGFSGSSERRRTSGRRITD